jgi:hypothetical protein
MRAFWVIALCLGGVLRSEPIDAQTLGNLDALFRRVIELEQASNYAEAIVLAELYADGTAAQHGADSSEHAVALNQLAGSDPCPKDPRAAAWEPAQGQGCGPAGTASRTLAARLGQPARRNVPSRHRARDPAGEPRRTWPALANFLV